MSQLDEDEIVQCVSNINQERDLIEVFQLYDVPWNLDVFLTLRKMEYVCLKKEPIDEDYISFIECINEAHSRMLESICTSPRAFFVEMDQNPIISRNVLYGIPSNFQQIMNDIIINYKMFSEEDRSNDINLPNFS